MEVSAAALAWGLDVTVSLLCRFSGGNRELAAKHLAFFVDVTGETFFRD